MSAPAMPDPTPKANHPTSAAFVSAMENETRACESFARTVSSKPAPVEKLSPVAASVHEQRLSTLSTEQERAKASEVRRTAHVSSQVGPRDLGASCDAHASCDEKERPKPRGVPSFSSPSPSEHERQRKRASWKRTWRCSELCE